MQIVIDVPQDKIRQAQLEADRLSEYMDSWDETEIAQVSLHEACHLHYSRQLGLETDLVGPAIRYDVANDRFLYHGASVNHHGASFGEPVAIAKMYVSPALIVHRLTNRPIQKIIDECGNDFRVARKWWAEVWEHNEVLTEEEAFHQLLADTRESVQFDLRSPAFRRQLWETARECEAKVFA